MTRLLIISPQAGMGNRFRALAAAVVLATVTGRELRHAWFPETEPHLSHLPHVRAMQTLKLEQLLQAGQILPLATDTKIDCCYSEWLPGEYWHHYQSSAWRRYGNNCPIYRIDTDAQCLINSTAEVILLETSRAVGDWLDRATWAYQNYLRPLPEYSQRARSAAIGVSIRRGEFLDYFPEARQAPALLLVWLQRFQPEQLLLFSDDVPLRDTFRHQLNNQLDIERAGLPAWAQGFVEFISLSRCARVYGTPSSSFAIEAARYGGAQYAPISLE